jgi:hypothetical protein
LLQGASKFYLYNNRSSDNYFEVLQPYIELGIVDLTEWPNEVPCQCEAYQHFINRMNRTKIFCAFIDIDEFLFSPITDKIVDLFNKCPDKPLSIGVNWKCFGSGNQDFYEDKPVIERFYIRPPDNNSQNNYIKSIVRLDQNVTTTGDPHFFVCDSGNVNENNLPIGGSVSQHSTNILRINHYKSKSKEEWEQRERNGKPNAVYPFSWDHYFSVNTSELVEDREIQRFLPQLKQNLGLN